VPHDASQMYAKNIATFLLHLVNNGQLTVNLDNQITRETLVTRDGAVVHAKVREFLPAEHAAVSGENR